MTRADPRDPLLWKIRIAGHVLAKVQAAWQLRAD